MDGEHRQHQGLNNRAENSHQPTRRHERQRKRFKDPAQVQRFLAIHDPIDNLSHLRRDHRPVADYRNARTQAFQVWARSSARRWARNQKTAAIRREPHRVCLRPVWLSHAAMATASV